MKITLESTSMMVEVSEDGMGWVPGRVWEGQTDSGIKVTAVVTRIAAHKDEDLTQFERELTACREPQMPDAFPLRLIL